MCFARNLVSGIKPNFASFCTKIIDLDEVVKLFDFHQSRSVLVVDHEAELQHVRYAKTAKRAHRLDELAASHPTME